ncbi:MAG: SurA N-terminal domain-containing protein [Hyphomicrobiaceae bacterium]
MRGPVTNDIIERRYVRGALLVCAAALLALPAAGTSVVSTATAAPKASTSSNGTSGHAIVFLVNDEPITAYEIEQRQRLLALSANIGDRAKTTFQALLKRPETTARLKEILNKTIEEHKAKGRDAVVKIFEERKKQYALSLQKQAVDSARTGVLPTVKRTAIQELIEERLKLQEAKRNNVVVSDEQVSGIIKQIASRNKMTEEQFAKHLAGMGIDISTMKQRFRATVSWNDVVRRRFGYQIAISERDVDRFVDPSLGDGESDGGGASEVTVQRVLFPIAGGLDQKLMAQRLSDADAMRRSFKGCSTTAKLAKGAGATFQNLGARDPASIGEPTRTMLLSAKDGEMIPPNVGPDGIELWVICGRKAGASAAAGAGPQPQKASAKDERRQKELDILARRHLKDLRQDAVIDCRADAKSGLCSMM